MPAPGGLALKKRNSKIDDKHATSIQQTLLKSLGPEQKESPLIGPLAGKFQVSGRKFSLDMDYKEKVRN